MKNSIKKNLIVIGAVSAVFLSTASVFAATSAPATVRPMPASNQTTTSSTTSETSSSTTSGTSVTSSGTSASDETSVTGEGNYRATNGFDETDDTNVTRTVPTAIPAATTEAINVVSNTEQTSVDTKKYVSKGGMVGWLIVSIIINALISFWIGNRFHKLSQKDSHITAEIRALRRDVDEKFLQSVGGFSEQE
ncbi:MAG: hypothetical protein LIO59_00980, partial [Oscillospiraceae bacterium]|nr:hypothetical protein [Oscillospiraceae bacterium]